MAHNYTMQRISAQDIDIPALQQKTALLHSYIEKMRYEERSKLLDREATLYWIGNEIEALKDRVDLPQGWTDPEDDFADTALEVLRLEFMELTRPNNPYPVPQDDPRERTLNGKVVRRSTEWPALIEATRISKWSETGKRWLGFVKGDRPARFILAGGVQVIVVPLLASPPVNCKEWIRPGEFWQLVPPLLDYEWEVVSPFDWGTPEPTAASGGTTPHEKEIRRQAVIKASKGGKSQTEIVL